jgi:hypothetical protein
MDARTAKPIAQQAGLELYYDAQWQSWGLISPAMDVESIWLSPGELRSIDRNTFQAHYVDVMVDRIKEHAQ